MEISKSELIFLRDVLKEASLIIESTDEDILELDEALYILESILDKG